jgi:hypothetical protein
MQNLGTLGLYIHDATGANLAGTTIDGRFPPGANNAGRIVAWGWNDTPALRGFYYSGTAWVELGGVNHGASQAFAINRCGVIAGISFLPTGGSQAEKWTTNSC